MTAIHADRRSLGADVWVVRLGALDPVDPFECRALDRLRAWDRVMDAGSIAAAVYTAVRDAACRIVSHSHGLAPLRVPFPGEPPATFSPLELRLWVLLPGLLASDDPSLLPPGRDWDDVLGSALADGVGLLRTVFGDDAAEGRHPGGAQ